MRFGVLGAFILYALHDGSQQIAALKRGQYG